MEIDWQAVAAYLAEHLMGWHEGTNEPFRFGGTYRVWIDSAGGMESYYGWRPDEDWRQAGQVVEAMRVNGWTREVSIDGDYRMVKYKRNEGDVWHPKRGKAAVEDGSLTELQCNALAAVKALGMEA